MKASKAIFAIGILIMSLSFTSCGSTSGSTGSGNSSGNTNQFTGTIRGDGYRDHTISFRQGQQLTVTLEAGNSCYFNVLAAGNETIYNGSVNGNRFSGTMSFTGSYTIRIYLMGAANSNNQSVNYKLRYQLQ